MLSSNFQRIMFEPIRRRRSRQVRIGKLTIGGEHPIAVQSMTTTKTEDVDATVEQIFKLKEAGCEIVRVAVPTRKHVQYMKEIVRQVDGEIPIVADVHFDYKIAVMVAEVGVDKIRINPGNIGGFQKVKEVISSAKANGIPIRIGVNAGSLERELVDKYGGVTADALVESALRWIRFFEDNNFYDIVVSVKSAIVPQMIEAYTKLASMTDVPLHLGVTEAGPLRSGIVKSAIGIGALLYNGIGDTFRVSLASDPIEEVKTAWEILKALEIRSNGPSIIACPTCGRTKVDLLPLVEKVERALEKEKLPIKVAVMGCEVNGPGEARMADVGIASGYRSGVVFRKGKPVRRVSEEELLEALMQEIEKIKEELSQKSAK